MNCNSEAKSLRILTLYNRLLNGAVVKKKDAAQEFHVTERSIMRDIEDLRAFFSEQRQAQEVLYDASVKGYRLAKVQEMGLAKGELLAVCKILLESRSLRSDEMIPLLKKLEGYCASPGDVKAIHTLIANESHHYIEPHHSTKIIDTLWDLGDAIKNQFVIEVEYQKLKGQKIVTRRLQPVGLMFMEYYFYLVGFIVGIDKKAHFENADDLFPTIYRVDRIKSFHVSKEHFSIPYHGRFEEGEFRKRVQFMYGGKLQKVRFVYTGPSIEAVLDRLPTAVVEEEKEGRFIVSAEVFGKGIDMWLRSQGDMIEPLDQ